MLIITVDEFVEYIDITGPDGETLRLMPWDVPYQPGLSWPLIIPGRGRIGTMLALADQRIGFQDVDRSWQIVRSNANVRRPKGVAK